ncbi:MAG: MBL fold metallo-hydrolase [Leptospira sp.]|nr:MBL fold metallo-hydrolase [Leptospira sp.]
MPVKIETFPVYPLGCNCSIISCTESPECIVVDPGGDEERIFAYLNANGLRVKFIVHTHAHFDHCLGTGTIARAQDGCNVCLHKDDLFLYNNLPMQCKMFGIRYSGQEVGINHFLEDNEILQFGEGNKVEVLHTPGHSPGSVCFTVETREEKILFSGDTLFSGSIGRTDLWGGDPNQIIRSIRQRLFVLDDSTLVIPGHGEETKIFNEKNYNPFF